MPNLATAIEERCLCLGTPNLRILAELELKRLRADPLLHADQLLMAVYGTKKSDYSALLIDSVKTLRALRRSARLGMDCAYYAVPREVVAKHS